MLIVSHCSRNIPSQIIERTLQMQNKTISSHRSVSLNSWISYLRFKKKCRYINSSRYYYYYYYLYYIMLFGSGKRENKELQDKNGNTESSGPTEHRMTCRNQTKLITTKRNS